MLLIRLFVVTHFLFFSFLAKAQKTCTIPFHLTEYNNLSIQVILNEKDTVNLMFHRAAVFAGGMGRPTDHSTALIKSRRKAGSLKSSQWPSEV